MAASNYYGYAYGTVAPQYSIQLPPAYSHQTTGSYSVQPAPAVAYTASFSPATAHNPQPVVSQTYQPYQTQATPNYSFGQQEVAPQQNSTSQTYQIFSEGGICSYGQPSLVSSYENKPYYQTSDTTPQRSPLDAFFQTGVKSDYRPVSAVYSQSPPQGQATVLKTLPPTSSVSTSYSVYPVSTTVQQPPSSISTFTPSSSYNSTAATSYNCHSYSSYEPRSYISTPSYYQATQHLVPQCHSQPQGPSHHPQSSSHQPQGSSHQPPLPPQQAQTPATQLTSLSWSSSRNSSRVTGSAVSTYRKPTFHQNKVQKPKGPPKQPQLHYCDICKISCAGPQTYREHLEGQKHKKKEVLLKSSSQVTNGPHSVQIQLRCELCDVSCTGADAYKAHIRGAKHLKVVKLHTKLGKPIPSTEPVFVNSASVPMTTITAKPTTAPVSSAVPMKLPFVKPPKTETMKTRVLSKTIVVAKAAAPDQVRVDEMKQAVLKSDLLNEDEGSGGGAQGNVQPVGHDYVEEICSDDGKLVRFHCKLCECSFNDPNAKDMHLKGRRHRLQYKKKVNPDLLVEIKPSNRARKLLEDKLRKQNQKAVLKRQLENEQRWHIEMRRYEEDMCWRRVEEEHLYWEEQRCQLAPPLFTSHTGMPVPPLLPVRRPDSPEDHHIMAKHASIYPADQELEAVQRIVSHSERGLKLVSDLLVEQDGKEAVDNKAELLKGRVLKGVMRVGILAKGLLLHGDRNIQLILLTAKRPTITLLNSIAQLLPKQLRTFSEDQYVVQAQPEEANIIIISSKEPKMQVTVCLTSPVMREEPEPAPGTEGKAGDKLPEKVPEDPADALNRTKCLEYLAALRHTKWFQSRANGLQSCVIIIRVLRDLCQRMPTWSKMPDWAMELLIEKALSSALTPLSPGKALRRVLECIASGILLQDGPGLIDPCEKVQTDALKTMTKQAREDLTASAQHALRLLAFRHIHKLLGRDSLPVSKASTCNRKRQRDKADEVEGEGKRNKKDF